MRPAMEAELPGELPGLEYAAALIGDGSDVLGVDDARCTGHGRGPRLQLFLREPHKRRYASVVERLVRHALRRV